MKYFTAKMALACLAALSVGGPLRAQYQLSNPGFEGAWTENTRNKYSEQTPAGWNSFYTARTGPLTGLAFSMANQIGTLTQSKEAHRGNYSAVITSRENIIGSVSNGNLTLGRINMGSTTATDAENYNFTDLTDSSCSYAFQGYPDSVVVWVKFIPVESADKASLNFILHKKYAFKQPHETEENRAKYQVALANNPEIASTLENGKAVWKRISTPFVYDDANTNSQENYLLASFSTNSQPGSGSSGDSLYVDDVEMIYNSKLSDLQFKGTTLKGFHKDQFTYEVDDTFTDHSLTALSDGKGARVSITYDVLMAVATVRVEGNNILADATNFHEYTIRFAKDEAADIAGIYRGKLNVSINGNDCPETDEFVTIETNDDRSLATFILKDFYLVTVDEKSGVGTICIPEIPVVDAGEGGTKLESALNIVIQEGSDSTVYWLGPFLGEIPIVLDATIRDNQMDVLIDISFLELTIKVRFEGTKDTPDGLSRVNLEKESAFVYRIDENSVGVEGFEEGSGYQIYSHSGALVRNGILNSKIIHTEGLLPGIYLMKVGDKVLKFAR